MKNKHMSFDDRLEIEAGLKQQLSFKAISEVIGKDCTTVAKEIKNHYQVYQKGGIGKPFNNCIHRINCPFREKGKFCNVKHCSHYEQEQCLKLKKAPYVCNGCPKRHSCTLEKHLYEAEYAQKEYTSILKESREGISYSKETLDHYNEILVPLIVNQKQSVHHALINNKNKILCSEKEIYNLIDKGVLQVKNIDLPRKVRYRLHQKKKTYYKIDKNCLVGRTYQDFKNYIKENPDTPIVELDTVEGIKGGKVLITIHFVNSHFMFAFLKDYHDAQSVIDVFNELETILGLEVFQKLFVVILTDNGSEFSNPTEIEFSKEKIQRTKIFYCEPSRPDQKGHCEVNHEFIRRVLPKGSSFNNLTQEDINTLMSHINSYKRKELNDCNPIQLFSLMYGQNILKKLNIKEIPSNDINLSGDFFHKLK